MPDEEIPSTVVEWNQMPAFAEAPPIYDFGGEAAFFPKGITDYTVSYGLGSYDFMCTHKGEDHSVSISNDFFHRMDIDSVKKAIRNQFEAMIGIKSKKSKTRELMKKLLK